MYNSDASRIANNSHRHIVAQDNNVLNDHAALIQAKTVPNQSLTYGHQNLPHFVVQRLAAAHHLIFCQSLSTYFHSPRFLVWPETVAYTKYFDNRLKISEAFLETFSESPWS